MIQQEPPQNHQIYHCTFEVHVHDATMTIKFPCTFMIQLKSLNGKIIFAMTKNRVSAVKSVATFNETLRFETQLMYDQSAKEFHKKDVLLNMSLLSNRRPDQPKLVGRMNIDLAQVINEGMYATPHIYKLQYCSINAHVCFDAKFLGKKISQTPIDKFDHDSITDYQSFISGLNKSKQYDYRNYDQQKTIQIGRRGRAETLQRNKLDHEYPEVVKNQAEKRPAKKRDHSLTQRDNENMIIPKLGILDKQEKQDQQNKKMRETHNIHYDRAVTQHRVATEKSEGEIPGMSFDQGQSPSIIQSQTQYEQVLRNNYNQQKKLWEEEKKMLQEQYNREKNESVKSRQKIQQISKKLYEVEMKASTMEGRVENAKKQMLILQKEKDLQKKELQNKVQKLEKQKKQITEKCKNVQAQLKQHKQTTKKNDSKTQLRQEELISKKYELQEQLGEANIRIKELEMIVDQLNQEMNKRQRDNATQIEQIKNKYNQMEENVHDFKYNLKNAETEINKLTSQMQKDQQHYEAKINQLNQGYERKQQQFDSVLKQVQIMLDQKNQQFYNLQKDYDILKNQKEELIAENYPTQIVDLIGTIDEKDNVIYDLESKIQEQHNLFQQNNEHMQEIIKKMTEDKNKNQDVYKQKEAQILILQQKIETVHKSTENKNSQIEKLNKEIQKLLSQKNQSEKYQKQYKANLEQQILDMHEKSGKNEELAKSLQILNQKLKNEISEMKQYQKGLENDICVFHQQNYEEKLKNMEINLQERVKEIEMLYQQINQRKQANFKLQQQVNELKGQIQSYESGNNSSQISIVSLQKQIGDLKQTIECLEKEKESLKMMNMSLKQSQLKIESQNIKNSKQVVIPENEGNEEMEQLKNQINSQRQYINSIEEQLRINFQNITQLEGQVEFLRNKNLDLEEDLIASRQTQNQKRQGNPQSNQIEQKYQIKIKQYEKTIQKLKEQGKKSQEALVNGNKATDNKQKPVEDKDYLALQQQLNQKDSYILKIEEQLAKKTTDIEGLLLKIQEMEDSNAKKPQNIQQQYTFNNNVNEGQYENFGNIRIHNVHSPSSAGSQTDRKEQQMVLPPNLQKQMNWDSFPTSPIKQQPQTQQKAHISEQERSQYIVQINELKQNMIKISSSLEETENMKMAFQNEVETNQSEINRLMAEIQSLQSRNQEFEQQIRVFEEELKGLKEELCLNKQRQNEHEITVKTLRTTIKQLEQSCDYFEEKIGSLKEKQRSMEKTLKIIEEQSQKIITELENKEIQLDRAQVELISRHKIIDTLNQRIGLLQKQKKGAEELWNQETQIMRSQLNQALEGLQLSLSNRNDQICMLKENLKTQKLENKKLQKQLEEAATQIMALNRQIQLEQKQYEIRLKDSGSKNKNLQEELRSLNEQMTTNKRLLSKMREKEAKAGNSDIKQDIIQEMQSRVEQLQQELFNYQTNENQKQLRITELQKKIATLLQANKSGQNAVKQQAYRELQSQYNYCSDQLKLITANFQQIEAKYTQLEMQYNNKIMEIQELSYQLEILQQNQSAKKSSPQKSPEQKRMMELSKELTDTKNKLIEKESQSNATIAKLQRKISELMCQIEKLRIDFEERQIESMNNQLDLQFRLKQKNDKSNLGSSIINDKEMRKSLNASQDVCMNQIIPATKMLKEILAERSNKTNSEQQISKLIRHVMSLEDQIFAINNKSREKAIILEEARILSMEFSKHKASILKNKMPFPERNQLLMGMKPIQKSLKNILNNAELLGENWLQNSSREGEQMDTK